MKMEFPKCENDTHEESFLPQSKWFDFLWLLDRNFRKLFSSQKMMSSKEIERERKLKEGLENCSR
jgi:hypothetical protein